MVTTALPTAGLILYSWFSSGCATVVVPLVVFFISRLANNGSQSEDYAVNDDGLGNYSVSWLSYRGDKTSPVLIATYIWSQLVFFCILIYGFHIMRAGTDLNSIVVALVLFANYSAMSALLIVCVNGAVETHGSAVDNHGFAGQFGVMVGGRLDWGRLKSADDYKLVTLFLSIWTLW